MSAKDERLDKFARCTITIPINLLIRIDIERKKQNLTRSAFITRVLESNVLGDNDEKIDKFAEIDNKLKKIESLLFSK
jgi:hypothetical protein